MDEFLAKGKFAHPIERSRIESDWHSRGFSCQPFRDPPGRVWPDFIHESNELVTVERGRLEIVIDGSSLIAEEGDEVFIPKRAIHTVRNISESETAWLFGYD